MAAVIPIKATFTGSDPTGLAELQSADFIAISNGGTGATTASGARTALGIAIGSDVQAYDAQLADIAGLTPTDGNFIVGDGTNFVAESGATVRTSLGLGTSDSVTFSSVSASLTGNVTGNVTGNLTGDVTGNADTATALATARTIAGQSFDGTANISIAPTDLTGVTSTASELNILDGATLTTTELNYVDGVTSAIQTQLNAKIETLGDLSVTATATELNILDGVTSTTAELNILDGVTATTAEINKLDGLTATTTELNYVDGVTSAIQTQLDGKLSTTGGTISSNLTVTGNLTVNGTTTTVNSNTVNIGDNILVLNSDETGTPSQNGGIEIERGTSTNKTFVWDETNDKWTIGSETFVAGTIEANVTGNVTGDVTGNADTATTLETARTIGGVSFDGSANINLPGVNTTGNQDTSGNAATATALATARTIGGVSFDGTANINLPGVNTTGNQDTSGNAATATILATARTIAGQSFNGSANISIAPTDLTGVTATASELNILDGATLTTTELNYVDGVTSNIQTQLNAKGTVSSLSDLSITATATEINKLDGVTATTAELNILDGVTATAAEINKLDGVTATTTELNYVDGVTSAIQTQLDSKLASSSYTASDVLTKIKTVDGASSGLDADLLDGQQGSYYLDYNNFTNTPTAASEGFAIAMGIALG